MSRRDRTQSPPETRPRETVHTDPATTRRPATQQCRCGGWYTPDPSGGKEHNAVFGHNPIGAV